MELKDIKKEFIVEDELDFLKRKKLRLEFQIQMKIINNHIKVIVCKGKAVDIKPRLAKCSSVNKINEIFDLTDEYLDVLNKIKEQTQNGDENE